MSETPLEDESFMDQFLPENCDAEAPSMLDGHCRCMICGRCGHHTGNGHQGHYWKYCKVTKTMREFHFCCPDDCELEAKSD